MTETVWIRGNYQRDYAKRLIDAAPDGAVVKIGPPRRSISQNDLMWSLCEDLSKQQPEGRKWTKDTWKAAAMHAAGHAVQFEIGLEDSGPFPIGFRSSGLTKAQMSVLIEYLYSYGARHGVTFKHEGNDQ